MAEPQGLRARPLEAVAGFAAHLRAHGFRIGIADQQAMLQTALAFDVAAWRKLEGGWRSLVCGGADEWRRYPELFARYWFPQRARGRLRSRGPPRPPRDLRELVAELHAAAAGAPAALGGDGGMGGDLPANIAADERHARGGASRADPLVTRDFRAWPMDDLADLERRVEDLARRMRTRLTRRRRGDPRGQILDLRGTLRRSLRTGGIPFAPAWQKRRRERPRLFILVDISRSMELYARFFLQVARVFATVLGARVFVFHTRLAEVTALLRRPGARAGEKFNAVTAGFGGGTRIATSLADFTHRHARGALSASSRVLIMSDGFDSDGEEELAGQVAAVRARQARVYWLHPSRDPPQSAALAPCAELITAFVPVHDLASLGRLDRLADPDGSRQVRGREKDSSRRTATGSR